MKKILLFITLINFTIITQAQIVNIPDANFKTTLLSASPTIHIAKDINGNWITIDTNNNGEIEISEVDNIDYLNVFNKNISDLTGIVEFFYLNKLICSDNNLTTLDVSSNFHLKKLFCRDNNLNTINLNINLNELYCSDNNLTALDLNNTALTKLECYNNNLTTLDVSTNTNLTRLSCYGNSLITTINLNANTNLTYLHCADNGLTHLDLSTNTDLDYLNCNGNNLTTLDLSTNTNLSDLRCSDNDLSTIDVSTNTNLLYLECNANNNLTDLDLSNCPNLILIDLNNNSNLTYLNLKNGNNHNIIIGNGLSLSNCPNIEIICVDDIQSTFVSNIISVFNLGNTFTEYCSLTPMLKNQITGIIKVDLDTNGCDINDLNLIDVLVTTNNGTESFVTFTQNNGDYLLYTNEGNFTTSVTTNLPSYFTVNPNSETNTFTGFDNTFTADFCIEPNQTVNDVNISLIPTSQARPGFNTTYKIVYKNVGTTQLNGDAILEFDETKLSFLNASETINTQTSNSLTFDYVNLNPFETGIIDLEFNVFAPPTVNIDDVLNFTATINPIAGDFTTDDNVFTFNQTVIGSFDPNDITVLEGNQILLADADKYLHYVIRFQNTGTASAINVVVANDLDANLDWSTLQLESLSHNNRIAIKNGSEIEFIFENINLPDSTTDEPNSHGFIAYKIKPKTDIALGDIIPNKADIFFDYNEAIETNTVTTEIVNVLAVNENTILDFSIYPIPTENILNIKSRTEITKIEIYSKLGQKIKETTENQIDISNLTQGLYFVKVEDINGNFGVKKIVKI